jgi:hypothetical protein
MQTKIDYDSKEAHLDSIKLTYGIQATRRNDVGNSGLHSPIPLESLMREFVIDTCYGRKSMLRPKVYATAESLHYS